MPCRVLLLVLFSRRHLHSTGVNVNYSAKVVLYLSGYLVANYLLNNHLPSTKSVVRYLGLFIISHLKWSDHVKFLSAKATRSLNILRHSLYTYPFSVKAAVYKCVVHPILEYASLVWYLHSSVKLLESVQHRAAIWVCGS